MLRKVVLIFVLLFFTFLALFTSVLAHIGEQVGQNAQENERTDERRALSRLTYAHLPCRVPLQWVPGAVALVKKLQLQLSRVELQRANNGSIDTQNEGDGELRLADFDRIVPLEHLEGDQNEQENAQELNEENCTKQVD